MTLSSSSSWLLKGHLRAALLMELIIAVIAIIEWSMSCAILGVADWIVVALVNSPGSGALNGSSLGGAPSDMFVAVAFAVNVALIKRSTVGATVGVEFAVAVVDVIVGKVHRSMNEFKTGVLARGHVNEYRLGMGVVKRRTRMQNNPIAMGPKK
jgi:hypothetical protein